MAKTISTEAAAVAIECIDAQIEEQKASKPIAELAPLFDARRELSEFTDGEPAPAKKTKTSKTKTRTALGGGGSRALEDVSAT